MEHLGEILKGMYRDVVVRNDEPLSEHTSMQVGGKADLYVMPKHETALTDLVAALAELGIPYEVIGRGTNVIARDGGVRGVVIEVGKGLDAIAVDGGRRTVTAGAGAALSAVAGKAAEAGLSGLEPISGIPGTVGGALFMNAGAYGGEMSHVVTQARAYDVDAGRIRTMNLYEMRLGYRTSIFRSGRYVILSVRFGLKPKETKEIKAAMSGFRRRRNAKQPMDLPSSGSFFKRPEGAYAGQLIEEAGLKGLSVGGAQISEKHAGFIVNNGGATAADVLALMEKVRAAVRERSGFVLHPEPRIIGEG
jgi:UDP-N-acetylmuramate dehydrogenase